MSKQRLTSCEIPTLKRLGKAIKREQNISHSEALNRIARQYGYEAWSHLQAEALVSKSHEVLLREFFDGQREQSHLILVILIWERIPDPSLINILLSQLVYESEKLAIGKVFCDYKKESPSELYSAIDKAHRERELAYWVEDERVSALMENAIDDQAFFEYEVRNQMDMFLAALPTQIQKTILDYRFTATDGDASRRLRDDLKFYQSHQDHIDHVLFSVVSIFSSNKFSSAETLGIWLVSTFNQSESGLCPLDALWSDTAFNYLRSQAEEVERKAVEAQQKVDLDHWMSNPEAVPLEVRHFLKSRDIALANITKLQVAFDCAALTSALSEIDSDIGIDI